MLRQFLMSALLIGSIVPAGSAIAAMRTVVEDDKEICHRQSDGSWTCKDKDLKKSAVLVCTPDLICTESGEPLPKGTVIKPGLLAIAPRSDRGNPKPSTIDDRRADANCPIVARTPRGIIRMCRPLWEKEQAIVASSFNAICTRQTLEKCPVDPTVQDPSTPDGKNEPVFPGLPPAPDFASH